MPDAPDRDVHPLDDALWTQAVRLVAGDCAPDEARALRAWFEGEPARRAVLDAASAAWDDTAPLAAPAPMPAWDTERALASMAARLPAATHAARAGTLDVGDGDRRDRGHHAPRHAARAPWRPRLVAAAAVAVVGAGLAWRALARGGPAALAPVADAGAVREVRAEPGTPRRVVLGDGTTVSLAPGSVLRVAAGYGAAHRDVVLEGEGRFTVAARAGAPRLRVLARGTVVEDVSTAFVVRVGDGAPRVAVGVLEGRVILRAAGDATLEAGMAAVADSAGAPRALPATAVAALAAATDGTLAFVDAPLDEVARRVARWHGVTVALGAGVPRDRRVTATFAREAPRALLEAVAASTGLALRDGRGGFTFVVPDAR